MRADEWPAIESLLKRGGRPKLDDILKAISTEEAIPPKTRAHIASLISGALKTRGRKAVPDGEDPLTHSFSKQNLRAIGELRFLLEVQRQRKLTNSLEAALAAAKPPRIDVSTARRYYLKARKNWPEVINDPHEIELS
jgi:hypothetical protein